MENQFVPYELAVKLKEMGFNESCFAYWRKPDNIQLIGVEYLLANQIMSRPSYIKAPLWQQAFDWFRKKGYDSHIAKTVALLISCAGHKPYYYSVCESGKEFDTYEEARQACLEKLIELSTNNNL
ncbi:hypothetical protein K7A41_09500 [Sphingobacterium sp. InxBP1]|uniref:hypothetical protein n=1 Tax=Sphingobacterium sp. InxBP1 TaxID=2870328 RepID=UPI00224482D7|nr:hypothetical protein [Sphingobacterium sp. InxBP1]MCW8311457.1 hypothetical protein [Sphingobacterium sp. InxBP1]